MQLLRLPPRKAGDSVFGRVPPVRRRAAIRPLLLRLALTPETESAFPDPEKAQAVEGDAKDVEVPQEYRIAHRESNADQDNACNYAFHILLKVRA